MTKQIASLNNKIIECRWSDNEWEFLRERKDKSYPNNVQTARGRYLKISPTLQHSTTIKRFNIFLIFFKAICQSLKNPITQERLLELIDFVEKKRAMSKKISIVDIMKF